MFDRSPARAFDSTAAAAGWLAAVLALAGAWLFAAPLAVAADPVEVAADADLADQEEAAIRAAVQAAAPSIVRIETIGGLDRVGDVQFGLGPSTGLIVSEDGYVVSSAFNFARQPTSILVGLPDGARVPARLVATDHSRRLVLLKAQTTDKLPVPAIAPEEEIAVGQWAIAVGRTFELTQPNVSVGIVSALRRIQGRAIQTDAKISPSNYGGPLLDVRGRVMGILVPLSPENDAVTSGFDWYDSGIGFAAPLAHVVAALPRLKKGEDLHPGIMGVSIRRGDQFADPPIIAAVRGNSPAAAAGFKPGDQIVEIAGQPLVRQIQVREFLGPFYAGDNVQIAVKRGDERITRELTLIAKLEPYVRPFLGVLPMRVARAGDDDALPSEGESAGLAVRMVFADSPAAAAGLQAGDRILAANDKPVHDAASLREAVIASETGQNLVLKVRRGQQELTLEAELAAHPESVPASLPPPIAQRKPYVGPQPPVGRQPLKLPEFANEAEIYVPEGYDPGVDHALVVWFHEPNGLKTPEQLDALLARWKDVCEKHDVILAVPRALDPVKWQPAKEMDFVTALTEKLLTTYAIDEQRLAAAGYQAGGTMACAAAFEKRELFRAAAAIDALPTGTPPDADAVQSLSLFITKAAKGRANPAQVEAAVKRLRDLNHPVVLKDQGEAARPLNDAEFAELLRWIDALDRI